MMSVDLDSNVCLFGITLGSLYFVTPEVAQIHAAARGLKTGKVEDGKWKMLVCRVVDTEI